MSFASPAYNCQGQRSSNAWKHFMISVKEDEYKKETVLFSVNQSHLDYLSFKPERRLIRVVIRLLKKPSRQNCLKYLRFISQVYMSIPFLLLLELILGSYTVLQKPLMLSSSKLVKPMNKSIVVLDPMLCDALFKGAIKKGSTYPTEIHKKDLGSTFVSRMQGHHIVTRGSESVVRKGSMKTIQIVTERRQGNKKVTKVKPMNKFIVVLDPKLCDALFKGAIKKGSTYPTEIHKKDLGSTFVNGCRATTL